MPKRIFELAKEFGISSKVVVTIARDRGMPEPLIKNHMTLLTDASVEQIKSWIAEHGPIPRVQRNTKRTRKQKDISIVSKPISSPSKTPLKSIHATRLLRSKSFSSIGYDTDKKSCVYIPPVHKRPPLGSMIHRQTYSIVDQDHVVPGETGNKNPLEHK